MQPLKRQQFICSAIEQCKETVNCCAHKQPHIKDERCVPRECRYAPGVENIDCEPYDPEKPRVPVPVEPAKTVEVVQEKETAVFFDETVNTTDKQFDELSKELAKESDIKEAVKKQSASKKKGGRKKS